MLDISTIEKYDLQKMYKVYDKWPEIARESFESKQESVVLDGVDPTPVKSIDYVKNSLERI